MRTVFYVFLGLLLLGGNVFAQTENTTTPVLSGQLSETELADFRSAYLKELNRQSPFTLTRKINLFSPIAPLGLDDKLTFGLQLRNAQPNYVPFTIAPPGSALAGVGAENPWNGTMPLRYSGNILLYPNDPTNGYGRMGLGMFSSMMGGYFGNPFFNRWNTMSMPYGGYGIFQPFNPTWGW